MPRGVYSPFSCAELEAMQRRMPAGTEQEIRLYYALTATSGVLRRLYNAVLATPLEGTALTEAMRETERALGIST